MSLQSHEGLAVASHENLTKQARGETEGHEA
jgi:hypothetical protein